MKRFIAAASVVLGAFGALVPCMPCDAQTATTVREPQPAFNLFTTAQDIDIGQQSAAVANKQLTFVKGERLDDYLDKLVKRLARGAPGKHFEYNVHAVNSAEINAFSLPGGPVYITAGMVAAVHNEGELAAVLAHEIAHVSMRHGTSEASRAYLARSGVGILGGMTGTRGSSPAAVMREIGGMGLNAAFLKFTLDEEYQADEVGAQVMSKAGYNPTAAADFLVFLAAQQASDAALSQRYLADHPPAADRETRLRQLALTIPREPPRDAADFARVKAGLKLAAATPANQSSWPVLMAGAAAPTAALVPVSVAVAAPSPRFAPFQQKSGFFTIEHPDNWHAHSTEQTFAATIAPEGGVVDLPGGQQAVVTGIVLNHYAPFEGTTGRWNGSLQHHYAPFDKNTPVRGVLEDATDDLVRQILRLSPYLHAVDGSAKSVLLDGSQTYSVLLEGVSPVTGQPETVTAFIRGLPDNHVIYALCIAPTRDYPTVEKTFLHILGTLRINEDAVHGPVAAAPLPER